MAGEPKLPFVPGHEGTGVVAAVGPGVTSVKEGDPADVAWLHDACSACEYCITGWETLCEAQHNSGYSEWIAGINRRIDIIGEYRTRRSTLQDPPKT